MSEKVSMGKLHREENQEEKKKKKIRWGVTERMYVRLSSNACLFHNKKNKKMLCVGMAMGRV